MKPDSRIRVMEIIARMNVGGPATLALGLSERLNQEEFAHRLYTGYVDDGEGDHLALKCSSTQVHRISGLGRSIRPSDDVRALFGLVSAMRTFRPHIVHTQTAKAGALGRVAVKLSGVGAARVHGFHGHLLDGYFSAPKRALYVRSERFLASMSDLLVTVGAQVRDDLLQAGIGRREQYVVIPPGVRLGPVPDRLVARRSLGLPPHAPVVAYVGRLTQVKRPDRFVAVAREVLRKVPGCHFVICGGGDLQERVEQDIGSLRQAFHLVGWRKDVETVYAAADVVLLTSDNEGTPLTLIEAQMAGTPVVATRVGSVAEVVQDGRTGLLAAADPAELADRTAHLLSTPSFARQLGAAAHSWATASFDVDSLVANTEALYRSLSEPRGARRVTAGGMNR
ncbi:glycosyltransferase [Nonomuraea cavernae]|uniref:glycosyltransferase n=1 Tax=Nonomuraea cavernae TaxID=2045107 RepID=UPI0034053BF5